MRVFEVLDSESDVKEALMRLKTQSVKVAIDSNLSAFSIYQVKKCFQDVSFSIERGKMLASGRPKSVSWKKLQ
jgi:ABC-type multidrug transport system fused ATPase/permease subunit